MTLVPPMMAQATNQAKLDILKAFGAWHPGPVEA